MKAVVIRQFGKPEDARVEEIPPVEPKVSQVQIEVCLAPANYVDTLVFSGTYQFLPERPFIPGKGPVGTVKAVGENVKSLKVGDRVLAMAEHGGYAQYATLDERDCYVLPDTMSFEDAASMSLAYDTAWVALMERARLKPLDKVLVLGATGAVGAAAVQLAKAKGAYVIGGVSSASKAHAASSLGCDATIDLSCIDLHDRLRQEVKAFTNGAGVDVVIDPLGGHFFDAALRAIAWRGRLVVVGFAAGAIPSVKANYLMLKNIEVSGVQISDYRKRLPDLLRVCFSDIFNLYAQGKVIPTKPTIFPLHKYAEVLENVVARKLVGRPLLDPWSTDS